LRFETTRGDRLFLSILSAGFINLGWIAWTDQSLWWALALSVAWSVLIYRKC
jgi:predicted small integral membrane protein